MVVDADCESDVGAAVLDDCTARGCGGGAAIPVGVVRALDWLATMHRRLAATPLHLAVNRAPSARYRREEIQAEIVRSIVPDIDHLAPRRPERSRPAAWNGDVAVRGPFHRAVEELCDAVAPETPRVRRRRSR